jgi:hypothetical protein
MRGGKAELNAHAGEVSVIAKALGVKVPVSATFVEQAQVASRAVSIGSQRDDIAEHVAKFKAHQQRLMKERQDFAARELKRMRASAFDHRAGGWASDPPIGWYRAK